MPADEVTRSVDDLMAALVTPAGMAGSQWHSHPSMLPVTLG